MDRNTPRLCRSGKNAGELRKTGLSRIDFSENESGSGGSSREDGGSGLRILHPPASPGGRGEIVA